MRLNRIIIVGLIFILFTPLILADNSQNVSFSFDLSNLSHYSRISIYQEREITESNAQIKIFWNVGNFTDYTDNIPIYILDMRLIGKNYTLFNLEINRNNKSNGVSFLDGNTPISLTLRPYDKIIISYNTDAGLVTMINKFWYPFDKYNYTIWSGAIPKIPFMQSVKISLPDTFSVRGYASSLLVYQKSLICETRNSTNGELISQEEIAKMTLLGDISSGEKIGVSCQSHNIAGDNFCRLSPLFITPRDLLEQYNLQNLSEDDFLGNVRNENTGYYAYLEITRVPITIFIFLISIIAVSLSTIYFEFIYKRDKKEIEVKRLKKILGTIFVIWTFQEGIVSLTSLSRPLTITLFDICPFIIAFTIFLIGYFFKTNQILKRDTKKFNKKLLKRKKIII